MKTTRKLLSILLAIAMIAGLWTAFPVEVLAALPSGSYTMIVARSEHVLYPDGIGGYHPSFYQYQLPVAPEYISYEIELNDGQDQLWQENHIDDFDYYTFTDTLSPGQEFVTENGEPYNTSNYNGTAPVYSIAAWKVDSNNTLIVNNCSVDKTDPKVQLTVSADKRTFTLKIEKGAAILNAGGETVDGFTKIRLDYYAKVTDPDQMEFYNMAEVSYVKDGTAISGNAHVILDIMHRIGSATFILKEVSKSVSGNDFIDKGAHGYRVPLFVEEGDELVYKITYKITGDEDKKAIGELNLVDILSDKFEFVSHMFWHNHGNFKVTQDALNPQKLIISNIQALGIGTYDIHFNVRVKDIAPGEEITNTVEGSNTTVVKAGCALTVSTGTGGTVSSAGGIFKAGDAVSVMATAISGYHFTGWTVTGVTITGGNTVNPATFNMPANAVTLTANFEQDMPATYALTANAGANGTVSGTASGSYAAGTAISVTATAISGYHFTGWTVTGVTITGGNTANPVTFNMPANAVTLTANFAYSGGSNNNNGSDYDPPPQKTPSEKAIEEIIKAKDGDTVKITLPGNDTTLKREVFEAIAGKGITLEISVGNVTWIINGKDVPKTGLKDINMGVSLGTKTIPANVINQITGGISTIQITLKHNGPFGFTLTLKAPLGKENAGYYANLYYYNTTGKKMEFKSAAKIDGDGYAFLSFNGASEYAIVIDTKSHEKAELVNPYTDVSKSDWFYDAVMYLYERGIMIGMGNDEFGGNTNLSRAMMVQIFYNLAGNPDVDGLPNPFDDVAEGAWYTNAIKWAAANGITVGYGNGKFGTNDPVTNEQLAMFIYNLQKSSGKIPPDILMDYEHPDWDKIADWAKGAVNTLTIQGIFLDLSGANFNPQDPASRAAVASALYRYLTAIG